MIKLLGFALFGSAVRRLGVTCALALAALALTPAAHADQVYAGSAMGSNFTSTNYIDINAPGTLTVNVFDLGVPMTIVDRLDSLSFSVMRSTNVYGSFEGEGTLSVDIADAGTIALTLFGLAQPLKYGMLSWNATFVPNASAVPLPASFWLLLVALVLAMGLQRKRAKVISRQGGDALPWFTGLTPAH